jgi:deoxyribose-phosphate aldolase
MMEVIRDMGVSKTVGFKPAGGAYRRRRAAVPGDCRRAVRRRLGGFPSLPLGASSLLASLLKALGHGDGKSASSY